MYPYDYKIEHIAGKDNVADSLSRLPLPETEDNSYVDTYMDRVLSVNMMDVQALTLEELKRATMEDTTLTQLTSIVETGQ